MSNSTYSWRKRMSKKKSYMNNNNLLSEGFFDKLFKKFNIKDKSIKKKVENDRTLGQAVKALNKSTEDIEARLRKTTGDSKIKLQRYNILDFF